jgi:hypothetical protein
MRGLSFDTVSAVDGWFRSFLKERPVLDFSNPTHGLVIYGLTVDIDVVRSTCKAL